MNCDEKLDRAEQHRIVLARGVKACKLATVLLSLDTTAEQAARLDSAGRRAAAIIAGVNRPSEDTWQLVVELLHRHEKVSTR